MSRLIDADKLKKNSDITNWDKPYGCSFDVIDNMPTIIDAVEVVRCKDCKYWKQHFEPNMGECHCTQWDNDYFYYLTKDTDFCSYGKSKDKEV